MHTIYIAIHMFLVNLYDVFLKMVNFKQIVLVLLVMGFSAASTQVACAKPRLQKFFTEKVEISRLEDRLSRAVITVGGTVFLIHMILGPIELPRYMSIKAPQTSERFTIDLYKALKNPELVKITPTYENGMTISFLLNKAHLIVMPSPTDSDAAEPLFEPDLIQSSVIKFLKNMMPNNKENSEISDDTIVQGTQVKELVLDIGYRIVKVDSVFYLVDENNIVH